MSHIDLARRAICRDIRAVSRLMTVFENKAEGFEEAYATVYPYTGRAHVIGVTGPPGSGKSTLVDKIVGGFRERGRLVGIVAVDPTSPFTGGALLGDRVRMQRHSTDDGVFIRSMGTRGHLGGVSRATSGAVDVLDAAGYDYVIIETVGVGQSEVEIASIADTVVLVQVPGLGDDIQVIKAGVMEIGDIFVVNKKDRPGVERTVAEIRVALELGGDGRAGGRGSGGHHGSAGSATKSKAGPEGESASASGSAPGWRPPILQTMAETGEGVPELCAQCDAHFNAMESSGALAERRYRRARTETMQITSERIWRGLEDDPHALQAAEDLAWSVARRATDPYGAAEALYRMLVG
ncbi:MAG: methylmalonyl Co-A mutase-associated GTPase MeaB [Clostridia bacterium]|nr:methylmalonyl Co-A mutase-associated GTPase MeaB [Clostridia bacterium]